jgi:PPOX class probable F420-dependent enzyme
MTFKERMARASDRMFDRLRDKQAFAVTEAGAVDGDLSPLRDHKYAVLVTFRRNGEAMPSPVWFGLDERGIAYVKTAPDVGKVKRLRNDSRVVIAPSTNRGKPVGPAIRAVGRVLPQAEWPRAEAALVAAYGSGRVLFERVVGASDEDSAYLEIAPRPPSG